MCWWNLEGVTTTVTAEHLDKCQCSKNVYVEELRWYRNYKVLSVQYSDHTDLKITSLRYDPFVDELLGVLCKTQEKFSICFQLVDGFNCLVNLVIQALKINNKTD